MPQIKLLQEDQRIFIDMPSDDTNPCLDCGVCCAHFRVSFYVGELSGDNGGKVPVEMTSKVNDVMACMKGTECGGGACVALGGKIGEKIWCNIYADRPSPCREYPVWMDDGSPNPDCQRLRKQFGLTELKHQS